MDLLTNDKVADFMNHRNDVGPFTQPSNVDENQALRRMSTLIGKTLHVERTTAFDDRVKIKT